MNTNRTEVVSMHTSERIYLLHILYDKYIYYSSSILASLVCIICIIKYSGIYSSGGQFGGFVTLAGVENFIFTLAGVNRFVFTPAGVDLANVLLQRGYLMQSAVVKSASAVI